MEICYYDTLKSTQSYLIEAILSKKLNTPILIYTHNQTQGIGSRQNEWHGIKGNLFFSFALDCNMLADDLPLPSISIYFGYIIKDILSSLGSSLVLKWPNDLYLDNKKIGGLITNKKTDFIVVGVGINLVNIKDDFHNLDINLDILNFFDILIDKINNRISWSSIFKLYKVEFYKSNFNYKVRNHKKSFCLKDAVLNKDGSISVNNEKVYSLR
ncbi:Biotin-protein ligase [hydrothermal vent metagenome]|uniref:Biotin-protein ligase n=1 Tax=hydrothermal vent metagenome TaxID=652676 RepID=A0A3B1DWH9_9ZZZZ